MQPGLPDMLAAFMEAQPEAMPILRRFFTMTAASDWAAEVPPATMEAAAPAMSAMQGALERRDYAEALAHLRVWADLLGVEGGAAGPG